MKTPLIFQILAAGTIRLIRTTLRITSLRTINTLPLILLLATGGVMLSQMPSVQASDKLSANEVLELMQQGKIKPLLTLISQHNFDGTLLDAELEREHGRLIYELEYLNDKGEVWEYELDAATGEIIEQERED